MYGTNTTQPPPQGYPPQGYPPQGYAPPAPPPAPPATKRKGRGCLIGCLVMILLLCVCGVVGAIGIRSMGRSRDLGVTYTEADYWNAVKKAGVQYADAPAAEDWKSTDVVYSGKKPINATFSPAEVSALFAYSHQGGWPISNTQVRFLGGNQVEMSAAFNFQGVSYPVYAKGSAGMKGKTVSGKVAEASVFGQKIPTEYLADGGDIVLGVINSRLARLGGLNITTAEVTPDGGLHLVGTVPAKAVRTKR
jgi:hypothetical protein